MGLPTSASDIAVRVVVVILLLAFSIFVLTPSLTPSQGAALNTGIGVIVLASVGYQIWTQRANKSKAQVE